MLIEQVDPIGLFMMEGGDIVITETKEGHEPGWQYFITPARISIQHTLSGQLGFMLQPWIPNELLSDTVLMITCKSVRGILHASSALIEFYKSWVNSEREKMELFAEPFAKEILQIKKVYEERHAAAKNNFQTHTNTNPNIISLSDEIIAMFEENNEWGNPKISN